MLAATAAGNRQTSIVAEDAATLVKKMGKIMKSLEMWMAEPNSLKEKGLAVLIQQFNNIIKEKTDVFEWAAKLGVPGFDKSASKRRKK